MKKAIMAVVVAAGLCMGPELRGAILTEAPDALMTSGGLDWASAGLYYQQLRRTVETETGEAWELQARTYEGVLGIDVLPWLTLYGSAGGSDARFMGVSDYGQDRFSWSLGLNMNIWQWKGYGEVPVWRLNFKARAEAARHETEDSRSETAWTDYSVAFPFGYEVLFARQSESSPEIDHLELYLGPMLSFIDGRYKPYGQSIDFDEKNSLGVLGGATLFVTKNFFAGISAGYFDNFRVRGGIGYSFE